jgi:hypothetical protein
MRQSRRELGHLRIGKKGALVPDREDLAVMRSAL